MRCRGGTSPRESRGQAEQPVRCRRGICASSRINENAILGHGSQETRIPDRLELYQIHRPAEQFSGRSRVLTKTPHLLYCLPLDRCPDSWTSVASAVASDSMAVSSMCAAGAAFGVYARHVLANRGAAMSRSAGAPSGGARAIRGCSASDLPRAPRRSVGDDHRAG